MLKASRAVTGAVGVLVFGYASLAAGVVGEEPIGLNVDQRVATRGRQVDLQAKPLCRIAGDDADSQERAVKFMTGFGIAVANALAAVDLGPGFAGWQGELRVVDQPEPASDEAGGVRILKSSPGHDVALRRALLRADLPALPNFRARCTFEVTLRTVEQE